MRTTAMRALAGWAGPVLAAVGIGVYLWYSLQSPPARGIVGFSVIAGVHAFDLSLPPLGLGLIFARLDWKPAIAGYAVFLVAVIGCALFSGPFADWLITTSGAVKRFVLVGPVACVLVGIALIVPAGIRLWLAPLAAALAGGGYGIAIRLFDPTAGDRRFTITLVLVALWLVTTPFLLGYRQTKPWFAIATRILGSWLIAIGMLLGALVVLPKRSPDTPPAPASSIPRRAADTAISLATDGFEISAVDGATLRA